MKFFGKVVLIVIIVLTVVFCVVGNDVYNNRRLINCTAVTTGKVTDLSRPGVAPSGRSLVTTSDYSVSATFTVNGITYSCRGRTDRLLSMGGEVEVHYSSSDPSLAYCGTGPRSAFSSAMIWIASFILVCILFLVGLFLRDKGITRSRYVSMSSY